MLQKVCLSVSSNCLTDIIVSWLYLYFFYASFLCSSSLPSFLTLFFPLLLPLIPLLSLQSLPPFPSVPSSSSSPSLLCLIHLNILFIEPNTSDYSHLYMLHYTITYQSQQLMIFVVYFQLGCNQCCQVSSCGRMG